MASNVYVIVPLNLNGFEEIRRLCRVLHELELLDLTSEGVSDVFERAGDMLVIIELVCLQVNNLDSIHFGQSLIQLLETDQIEAVCIHVSSLHRQVMGF